MTFASGTRVGPYEVQSILGSGGMGEVYRARDARLGRDVAIKILPEAVATDSERLARFEREAKTLAALSHSNIAHVYGLEESNGIRALVMELVEGEDLAERLCRGPIPIDEATAIARQIVDAVGAAHNQGIIHRDLKPANIKLRPDGVVKVLDFGLAKLTGGADGSPDVAGRTALSRSPTLTSPVGGTHAGTLLGTAPYMSPEQARGLVVDKRADIWAFGCVFYEMLTGRRAFAGDDVTVTLAEIIKGRPDWSALPAGLADGVKLAIERCLQKEPRQRLQDMGDVRLAIDGAFDGDGSMPKPRAATERGWRRALPWAAGFALGMAAVFAVWAMSPVDPSRVTRAEITLSTPEYSPFTLSEDGGTLIYVEDAGGRTRLMRRDLAQLTATPITGTAGATFPFLSADGRWVGFVAREGAKMTIRKVPIAGGTPSTICEVLDASPTDPVWLKDGDVVFGSSRGMFRVSATGGTPRQIIPVGFVGGAHELPGGVILFHVSPARGIEGSIEALVLSSGERTKITAGTHPRFLRTGYLLFNRSDGSMWAAPFDVKRLRLTRDPVPVGISTAKRSLVSPPQMAVSMDGTLAYIPGQAGATRRMLMWVDRGGVATPASQEPNSYGYPRLSPDDQRVAFGADEIWMKDLKRGTEHLLSRDRRGFGNPAPILTWGPGERVTFLRGSVDASTPEASTIDSTSTDGSEPSHPLLTSDGLAVPGSWSPDGTALAYQRRHRSRDLWVFRPGAPSRDEPFVATPANERAPMFSPDGRWIAYVSDTSGADEVYVQPYPGPGKRNIVSNNGGVEPRWSRDGSELFYRQGDSMMTVGVRRHGDTITLASPQPLFDGFYVRDTSGAAAFPHYDVAADGRFLMVAAPPGNDTKVILVLNWFEDLKRLIPE